MQPEEVQCSTQRLPRDYGMLPFMHIVVTVNNKQAH